MLLLPEMSLTKALSFLFLLILQCSLLRGQEYPFEPYNLQIDGLKRPTSLQFGPDGKLYISEQYGQIHIVEIERTPDNQYIVISQDSTDIINSITNHDDNGDVNLEVKNRQVTGILVGGSKEHPFLYVTSSDPRIGAGEDRGDLQLDTNSGVISKVYMDEEGYWQRIDLVRGLPRSEENHSQNGLIKLKNENTLLVTSGGNTNQGAPSNNFAYLPEYALSAAILSVDLNEIEQMPINTDEYGNQFVYDLPTLDDEDRSNLTETVHFTDVNDPFGGNNGKNQAMLIADSPIQVYSSGWRNAYDIIEDLNGRIYTFDNGPNRGWGGIPINNCSNESSEIDSEKYPDNLHRIYPGYYGGHPNPTRANRENLFNTTNPQSPIEEGLEDENCLYLIPGLEDGAIATNPSSTNGIDIYGGSNFNNGLKGQILAVSFNGDLTAYSLDPEGSSLSENGVSKLAQNFGDVPLDVTSQGDFDIFPGTIWVCNFVSNDLTVFEPIDFGTDFCDPSIASDDSDGDGFFNEDELVNDTSPCNPASLPSDFDNDFLSDILDLDDDNDELLDADDFFPLDSKNGNGNEIPFRIDFENEDDGGISGWGFTGLMQHPEKDYLDLFDPQNMTVGGAGLKFTIDAINGGTAIGEINTQENAFQFGIEIPPETKGFNFNSRLQGPFETIEQLEDQSYGIFVGKGEQQNYISFEIHANQGTPAFRIVKEINDIPRVLIIPLEDQLARFIDLQIVVDYSSNLILFNQSSDMEEFENIAILPLESDVITRNPAIGIIGSSGEIGKTFTGTWDFLEVMPLDYKNQGMWSEVQADGSSIPRHENGSVIVNNKLYVIGGRGEKPVSVYDFESNAWSQINGPPIELHHFQAIPVDELIYILGAFTGSFPTEVPVENIYILDTKTGEWRLGPLIDRPRGAAASLYSNGFIYLISGITNGHTDGWVSWVDRYNLASDRWEILSDIPHPRDHFFAAQNDTLIYVAGGRNSGKITTFTPLVKEIDVYNISNDNWTTLDNSLNIPTGRAGAFGEIINGELIIAGGESAQGAHYETESLNLESHTWRSLDSLNDSRHGTQAVVRDNLLYVANGSGDKGGLPELSSIERLNLPYLILDSLEEWQPSIIISNKSDVSINPFGSGFFNIEITNSSNQETAILESVSAAGSGVFNLIDRNFPINLAPLESIPLTFSYSDEDKHQVIDSLILSFEENLKFGTIYTKFVTPVFKAQEEPFVYNINLGGSGGIGDDSSLYLSDPFSDGERVTVSEQSPIPNSEGRILDNTTLEIPVGTGLYELTLSAIGSVEQSPVRIVLEDGLVSSTWHPAQGQSINAISYSVFVQDGSISINIEQGQLLLTSIRVRELNSKVTSLTALEDQVLSVTLNDLIPDAADESLENIKIERILNPSKGVLSFDNITSHDDLIALNNSSSISFLPSTNLNGYDTFQYLIFLEDSIFGWYKAEININPVDDPILLKNDAPQVLEVDEDKRLRVQIGDFIENIDNDPIAVVVDESVNEWLSQRGLSITGIPRNEHVGEFRTSLAFKEPNGNTIIHRININVINQNDPPQISESLPAYTSYVDSTLLISLEPSLFIDPDVGDNLRLSVTSGGQDLSSWIFVNNYEIIVKPLLQNEGDHNMTLTVTDDEGATASIGFTLSVLSVSLESDDEIIDVSEDSVEENSSEEEMPIIEETPVPVDSLSETPSDSLITMPSDSVIVIPEDTLVNIIPELQSIFLTLEDQNLLEISANVLAEGFNDPDSTGKKLIQIKEMPHFGDFKVNGGLAILDTTYDLIDIESITYETTVGFSTKDSVGLLANDGVNEASTISYIIISIQRPEVLSVESSKVSVAVYPNPVEDILQIKIDNINAVNSSLRVWDVSGKIILAKLLNKHLNYINLSETTPGIYILEIQYFGNVHRLRVVKK